MTVEKTNYKNSMLEVLGIEFVELSPERVVATMPVNQNSRQPYGLLHGGASVALAETVASEGTCQAIDRSKYYAVGMEINANHLRGKRDGIVTAVATPIHKGRSTMVWNIQIHDEQEKIICMSRCTMAIVSIEK
ncbi:MAG: hotdog fold thioesterase [Sporomusaceae bacterium]|nr:hotdog fold thioesterase [Sporomusaceae bacterium]